MGTFTHYITPSFDMKHQNLESFSFPVSHSAVNIVKLFEQPQPIGKYHRQLKFAGLNFCGFDPMKYFVEILSQFIGQEQLKYLSNTILIGSIKPISSCKIFMEKLSQSSSKP